MKKISLVFVLLLLVFGLSACGRGGDKKNDQEFQNPIINDEETQDVLNQTMAISKEYAALRLRTDDVLLTASTYPDYATWNNDISQVIADWESLALRAEKLEGAADDYAAEKVSFNLINSVQAYSNQEISDVFDKAPAGKKIKTLAKFLGVDAKKAFQILKQDQAQVEADAWNKAGDTFQKLETSAVLIKDACKVGVFVGTIALTGGTAAIAAGSTASQAAVVVSGADLVLEVTDDAAKIALGNHNKISQIVGDVRVVTEPAASLLMIATLPSNLVKGIDKLNAVSFGLDQFNSSVQEGKVIGIKLPAYTDTNKQVAEAAVIGKDEVNTWISDQKINNTSETAEEIKNILNSKPVESGDTNTGNTEALEQQTSELNNTPVQSGTTSDNEVAGLWEGILTYTPNQTDGEEEMSFIINLNADGTVDPSNNGEDFVTWEKTGNSIRIYAKDSPERAYYEFSLAGDTLTFVKLAGPNSEGKWQEDLAGSDFFGGKFYQISLRKQ